MICLTHLCCFLFSLEHLVLTCRFHPLARCHVSDSFCYSVYFSQLSYFFIAFSTQFKDWKRSVLERRPRGKSVLYFVVGCTCRTGFAQLSLVCKEFRKMLTFFTAAAKSGEKANRRLKHSDFIWDQTAIYAAYSTAALFVIGVGQDFLENADVKCLPPAYTNRDQAAYINSVCGKKISKVELLSFIFLLETVFLAIPHLMWKRLAKPALEQFFSMAPNIARYREKRTGLFEATTLDTVRCLQEQFSDTNLLRYNYIGKTACQLAAATIFMIIVALFYKVDDFQEQFVCDTHTLTHPPDWFVAEISEAVCTGTRHLGSQFSTISTSTTNQQGYNTSTTNVTVNACLRGSMVFRCSFRAAAILYWLWLANFVLLSVAMLATIYSLAWTVPCRVGRCRGRSWYNPLADHWQRLDYKGRALFLYQFCSHQGGKYKPNDDWRYESYIRSDLDLLVMMLFAYDKGHGRTFYEVQVEIALDDLWAKDYENYVTFQNKLAGHTMREDFEWRTTPEGADLQLRRTQVGDFINKYTRRNVFWLQRIVV